MPEPTVVPTANVANQPSPKPPAPEPPKPKAKGEKAKQFVAVHMGVGPFVKGDTFDPSDLYPDVDPEFVESAVQRLIDLGAIAPNAE